MVQFAGMDRKRYTIRLGKVSARAAENVRRFVGDLRNSKKTSEPVKTATAEWVGGLPDAQRKWLERAGFVEPRQQKYSPTVSEWVAGYVAGRKDVKDATSTVYSHTQRNLGDFFGQQRRLDEVSLGDADAFRVFLKTEEKLAENTVRRRIAIARQFFRAAIRRKIMAENPFDGQVTTVQGNPKRFYNVTRAETEGVLKACPTAGWRLVFALARYGGLRVASEVAGLRWRDINWDKMRFTVRASKTEHHDGGGERVVPIFPELYPYLLTAYEEAEEGAEFCCPQFANANQMYRKHVIEYVRQAGIVPWPKLFQNCRSTRETELAEHYPTHVVCKWIGNSPDIAGKFYLQVREEDFARACSALQIPKQSVLVSGSQGQEEKTPNVTGPAENGALRGTPESDESETVQPLGRGGLEPPTPAFSVRCSTS